MEPWSRAPVGRFDELEIESDLLRDNPLGDPHVRPLWVYMPPAYDAEPGRRFPSIYLIQGMTGQLDMWRNRSAFRPSTPERIDRLFAEEGCPAAVVVFVDAWTSYGGSQFIDSPGTGRYGEYGLATNAGDALFELCYLRDFPEVVRVLRDEYDGSFDRFWEDFRSRPAFTKQSDYPLLNTWGMAACYSANEDGSIDLPFDPATGILRDDVWQRWLAWDPVRMARRHADALRSLRAIYIDAGKKDEFFLDLGAEAFRRELEELGITDVFFELFDAGHGGIEYRYPLAIRYLAERLQ